MALVVVTDHPFDDLDLDRELLAAAGHELRFEGNVTSPEAIVALAAEADAVMNTYSPVPAEAIRGLRNCRVIARYGIGVDTIDIGEATARGIVVTNVPDYCIDEVSDHALALILSITRGVVPLDRGVRSGSWNREAAPRIRRHNGMTLGLVGFGRIARALAAKAAAVGFKVAAADPYVGDEAMVRTGVRPLGLEDLLGEADIVSVHAPLTPETRHLLGRERLALLRPGAILVNTSRGALVDSAALAEALADGRVAFAALDVLEREPPGPEDQLVSRDDVVMTPHVAFVSEESVVELRRKAVEQVVTVLLGKVPPYALNADAIAAR
ncbi:MAG: C-terminal binding protein [Nocardiopsaceae bacterium]|jgi:D-3-phosphoglycerate dehydrogenase|nr:C-terminal binding protein [Nocardiopsaceae bacterium]